MIYYSHQLKSFVHSVLVKYPSLLEYIREDKYKLADTGLTYRQVNSLDQSGLIRESRKSDKEWRSFNLNDLLYLHTIKSARLLNAGNAQLKYLTKLFYKQTINFKKVGEVTSSEIALVAMLASTNVPIGVLIFSDGDGILTDDPSISFSVGHIDIKKRAFIFVMLYQTFKPNIAKAKSENEFKTKFDLTEFENLYSPRPLSKKQKTFLNIIEEGGYTEISISKKPNGEIIINAAKIVNNPQLNRKDILKIFDEKSFGNMKVTKRENKDVSYRLEDVFKFSN